MIPIGEILELWWRFQSSFDVEFIPVGVGGIARCPHESDAFDLSSLPLQFERPGCHSQVHIMLAHIWLVGHHLSSCLLLGRDPIPIAVAQQFYGSLSISAVGGDGLQLLQGHLSRMAEAVVSPH